MATKNVPATKKETAVAIQEEMPDFLQQYGNMGNESVGAEDMAIPRMNIIQSISPEIDDSDPKYIEGAKAGEIFNSLTRDIYGESVSVIFVDRRKDYVVFKTRKAGGGFKGAFPTREEAEHAVNNMDVPRDQLEVVETASHFALVLNDDGSIRAEVMIPMTSTKLKVDRNLNSLIRTRGGPRFAGTYKIETVKEKNDRGTYFNFKVSMGPWANQQQVQRAAGLYEAIHAGQKTFSYEDETEEVDSDKF